MLPEELRPPFWQFFSNIDSHLSRGVRFRRNSDERGVTNNLLWCLDAEAEEAPPGLETSFADLRTAVAEIAGDDFPISLTFQAEEYSQQFEGNVSQADYVFDISFADTSKDISAPEYCWASTYFMQSKVAARKREKWPEGATFSRTAGQPDAIRDLRKLMGNSGVFYHLYCPNRALELAPRANLLQTLMAQDTSDQYWHHHREAGLWLNPLFPSSLNQLFRKPYNRPIPWSTFVMAHFFDAITPDGNTIETDKFYDAAQEEYRFRRALFNRERWAVDQAIDAREERAGKKIIRHQAYYQRDTGSMISIGVEFPTLDFERRFQPKPDPDTGQKSTFKK